MNASTTKDLKICINNVQNNNGKEHSIIKDNGKIENVSEFVYPGSLIINNYDDTK